MNGIFFNTSISIKLYEYEGKSADIFNGVSNLCSRYDSLFSATVEGSDIWNINHADSYPVQISEETANLLKDALYYSKLSDGKLDVTLGSLVTLWDFTSQAGSASPVIPDSVQIEEALTHCGYSNLILEEKNNIYLVTLLDPECRLELGCIAKGYIADKLDEYLRSVNVTSATISLGGNIKVVGHKPSGEDFKIGIQKPFGSTGEAITSVGISDSSVVSSGVYERYFESDGRLYHHILDSSTGYPVDNDVYGVSIKATASVTADALSTLCFILGKEEGLKLINSMDGIEALYIMNDYSMFYSDGWNKAN